jgi:transposase
MPNHPAPALIVDEGERTALRSLARAGRTEHRLVTRARIVLGAADGQPNHRIAVELRVSPITVLLWRRRFERDRLVGLRDAPRPGRERRYGRAERDRVIALTLSAPPAGLSHWSSRRLAREVGMSTRTVQRIWAEAGLQPYRTETFKFSTDPELEAKVRDVVGLYLAPPERAIVLSVDEKTQI